MERRLDTSTTPCYMRQKRGASHIPLSPTRMERKLRIKAGSVAVEAGLNDSATARLVWDVLPIEAEGETWGDEIYFGIPVKAELAKDAKEVVDLGDLGYWPPGNAFCIFFGPTPSSRTKHEIRPYSPVNVIGKVAGYATVFEKVRSGTKVRLERA